MDQQNAAAGSMADEVVPTAAAEQTPPTAPVAAVQARVAEVKGKAADTAAAISRTASQQAQSLSAQAATITSSVRPTLERGRQTLLDKPALLLGGALVVGIIFGRLV